MQSEPLTLSPYLHGSWVKCITNYVTDYRRWRVYIIT